MPPNLTKTELSQFPRKRQNRNQARQDCISASAYIEEVWEASSGVATFVMSSHTSELLKSFSLNKWWDRDHNLLETFCFARAYPPDLEAFGVDQDRFLSFLKNFEDASQASPWITAVFVAGGIVGFVPSVITQALSSGAYTPSNTALELQSRHRANTFLDQMNKDLFMLLRLYAMVLLSKDVSEAERGQTALGCNR
ncbi:hypothetical protein P154DRAFT_583333 [Amniculicola lignicola CBS 123094]|uniref:Uncharacterized protein n=1 Tax=Amniculicola lignicola CBS 123094 TaxID=1392246 RepID=A0A6A5VSW8_9PLEO|nr:hypothetical protein P154DRAFT_583333 [Amniculicola lignicola CBS 123094]